MAKETRTREGERRVSVWRQVIKKKKKKKGKKRGKRWKGWKTSTLTLLTLASDRALLSFTGVLTDW